MADSRITVELLASASPYERAYPEAGFDVATTGFIPEACLGSSSIWIRGLQSKRFEIHISWIGTILAGETGTLKQNIAAILILARFY